MQSVGISGYAVALLGVMKERDTSFFAQVMGDIISCHIISCHVMSATDTDVIVDDDDNAAGHNDDGERDNDDNEDNDDRCCLLVFTGSIRL